MFVPAASNSNPISNLIMSPIMAGLTLAQSETSTATWTVLMVVVGALVTGMFYLFRNLTGKVAKAEEKADAAEIKIADTRHNEMKTLVAQVGEDVKSVGHRMDKVEVRIGDLEIGHAEIKKQLEGGIGGAS